MKISYKQLLDEAMAEVETLSIQEAAALYGSEDVQFVDLRDVRELKLDGKNSACLPCAQEECLNFGLSGQPLIFKTIFAQDKVFLYCKSGWRSALATQTAQKMGLPKVCHIEGGFDAWKGIGADVEDL